MTLIAGVATACAAVPDADVETKHLIVHPAPAPPQALRYTLLPELRDRRPGNAVTSYYRAFSPDAWAPVTTHKDFYEKTEKWLSMPLKHLPTSDATWVMTLRALEDIDRGARRQYCDWELTDRLRTDGVGTLLPDLQALRTCGLLLSIRCRLELAAGAFDKVLYTLQTGFALAKHTGEGPTLLHALVGHAIGTGMLERLEELIQQPGAPNFYWALTALPPGLIDIRHALEGETVSVSGYTPELRELEKPMTVARAREAFDALLRQTGQWGPSPDAAQRLAAASWLALTYGRCKEHLVAAGRDPAMVEAMPAVQAVLLDTLSEFHRLRDEQFKAFHLPYLEARPILAHADDELKTALARNPQNVLLGVMAMLLPAVDKVHHTTGRTERKIAFLRTLEALRLHVAATGQAPDHLAAITVVPVPHDPLIGKPFAYEHQGGAAALAAPPGPSVPKGAGFSWRYELTFVK